MKVVFHPEAGDEFQAAIDYYEEKELGLGYDFAIEVHEASVVRLKNYIVHQGIKIPPGPPFSKGGSQMNTTSPFEKGGSRGISCTITPHFSRCNFLTGQHRFALT